MFQRRSMRKSVTLTLPLTLTLTVTVTTSAMKTLCRGEGRGWRAANLARESASKSSTETGWNERIERWISNRIKKIGTITSLFFLCCSLHFNWLTLLKSWVEFTLFSYTFSICQRTFSQGTLHCYSNFCSSASNIYLFCASLYAWW